MKEELTTWAPSSFFRIGRHNAGFTIVVKVLHLLNISIINSSNINIYQIFHILNNSRIMIQSVS